MSVGGGRRSEVCGRTSETAEDPAAEGLRRRAVDAESRKAVMRAFPSSPPRQHIAPDKGPMTHDP